MSPTPDFPPKLTPHDPRVLSKTATINGKKIHYLIGAPAPPTAGDSGPPARANLESSSASAIDAVSQPRGTVLLVHGWPDLSFGWRYQVPFLLSLGLRVIVPDLPGFGRSDSPQELTAYSYKNVTRDLLELVTQNVPGGKAQIEKEGGIIVGGHDWGGAVAWRFALWFPDLTRAVFSVCTPFWAPRAGGYMSLQQIVDAVLPNFRYQLQLSGPEVEAKVKGEEKIRQFLSGVYEAKGPNGERVFTTEKGCLFENLPKMGKSPLVDDREMEYYVKEVVGNDKGSLRGGLNWYRTTQVNYEEERDLIKQLEQRGKNAKTGDKIVEPPALFVQASNDEALPPAMAEGMERYFEKKLIKKEVQATHWAHWEQPVKVNQAIAEFLSPILKEVDAKL
ncbi:Alpha/Beta hydrolase protein [Sordaria brevicollis]|uniref:Alpha/Beta hydrolase protein n=1 Tax=Sordaria brevicollis TaxID=83679 RepID=A0AAE0P271_SORBR|nr:Alpha/Beta hydrolase protein [Sordaria brevicollis]